MKKSRLAFIVLAVAAFLYAGLSFLGGALVMQIPRLPLTGSPAAAGLDYESVAFPARGDGIMLKGWYLASRGERAVVIVHGGYQNRVDENVDTLGLTRDLVHQGYDILLFDLRGRGESQGKGRALSNIGNDLGGAIDYLNLKGYPPDSICLMGFCSGAALAGIFASEEHLGALVLDGCFPTVDGMVIKQAAQRAIHVFFVKMFIPGLILATRVMYDYRPVDPIDVIPKVACPVFFIHEQQDDLVSWPDTTRLFQAAGNPDNQIWEIPEAAHSQAYRSDPGQFVARVDNFLAGTLTRRTP
jgi:alpha-beta hydrolase superfamily lysophospholipase